MSKWVYESYHATLGTQLHSSLPFRNPKWSQVVQGNGSFSGKISIPRDAEARAQIKAATEKKVAAITIRDADNSIWPWGGPVISREWDRENNEITVNAIEWRTWYAWVFLAPKADLSGDVLYNWSQVDQLQIAKELSDFATSGGAAAGRPPISTSAMVGATSGILRDLNVQGLSFKRVGDLLTTMSNRDRGFDWGVEMRAQSPSNLPVPFFLAYYPERGGLVNGLLFKATPNGGNLIKYGSVTESGADQRERQWATGAGQPPDLPFAQDTDPNLGSALMREDVTNYSSVTERSTLASHARSERTFYSPGTQILPVEVSLDNPDVSTYSVGDRGRLIIQDGWLNWDLPAVRILEKTVVPDELKVQLTLDLANYTLPEVDAGGVV